GYTSYFAYFSSIASFANFAYFSSIASFANFAYFSSIASFANFASLTSSTIPYAWYWVSSNTGVSEK
ncbi:membrane protein, partial [gut metagenome]